MNMQARGYRTKRVLVFVLLVLAGSSSASWFGPKDYDECVLDNMRGVTLKEAVRAIKKSCRAKFPQACYEWQKGHNEYIESNRTKPWVVYARKSDPAMLTSLPSSDIPEGCGDVLR